MTYQSFTSFFSTSYERGGDLLLQQVIEDFPVSVIVFDKNLRFMVASNRFFEESPLEKAEAQPGRHWYDMVPDMPHKWKLIHGRCLKGERLRRESDPFYRKDGTVEWWKWEIVPWMKKRKVGGLVLYVENITAQKAKEHALKGSLKTLNRSNSALHRFAEQCAHDLRSPLRTMATYIDLMHKELRKGGTINPSVTACCDAIVESAYYMNTLITTTLDTAKGKDHQEGESFFSFEDVIQEAICHLYHEMDDAQRSMITFKHMPIVYGCKTELIQIAQNLMSNALKYTDKRPVHIEWRVTENQHYWIFSCADNGMGLDKKEGKQIFKEKKRLHPSILEGLGIGLFHTRRLLRHNGGRIWVKSPGRGKGCTFFFALPKKVSPPVEERNIA